jgi:hypothetical protein
MGWIVAVALGTTTSAAAATAAAINFLAALFPFRWERLPAEIRRSDAVGSAPMNLTS